MRKFTFIALLCMLHISGYAHESSASAPYSDIISKYRHLSFQQLLDTANWYYNRNSNDTALICYSLIINTPVGENDTAGNKLIVEAINMSEVLYSRMSDYRKSYELLIKALDLCERYHYNEYKLKIYANIGYIYSRFKEYDKAKSYMLQALNLCRDSVDIMIISNNLGSVEMESGQPDSVLKHLNRSLQISRKHNNIHSDAILNSIALFYKNTGQHDSAFHYFRLSLHESKKNNNPAYIADNLSALGMLLFKTDQPDSALYCINRSSTIAKENRLLDILAENYLKLSKIEESKEDHKNALKLFKTYYALKDSIFNAKNFSDIYQLQCLYDVSKTNQQIETLTVEHRIKERTIRYRTIILFITIGVLLLVSSALLLVFLQKNRLNTAYKTLFEKNIKIIELQESSILKHPEKSQKKTIADAAQQELLNKILTLMENTSTVCDAEFSINKLSEMVQSNSSYVSQIINSSLAKNFRSFLNSYRIKEAQRLFSEPDASKYTVESVAVQTGFKSRTTFIHSFKEITGISPGFYLKSIQKQSRDE